MLTLCIAASGFSDSPQITLSRTDRQAPSHRSELEPSKPSVAQGLRLILGVLLQILPIEYNWLPSMLLLMLEGFEFLRDCWLAYMRKKR